MPTGLKNSSDAGLPSATQIGPRRAINLSYQIVFDALNAPVRFPFAIVPLGCSVAIRGVNGSAPNAGDAYVGENAGQLLQGARQVISPDTEVNYPCDNLGQVWAMGQIGDGLIAYVRGNALP